MRLKEYSVIYVGLPFHNHTYLETLQVPLWRMFADNCVVMFNTQWQHIDLAMDLLNSYNLHYLTMRPIARRSHVPIVIGYRGKASDIWQLSKLYGGLSDNSHLLELANTWLGAPRLTVNIPESSNRSHTLHWDSIPPEGKTGLDPYAYPLRRMGFDINENLVTLVHSIREEYRNLKFSEWKILEKFAIMLVSSQLTFEECKQLMIESLDGDYSLDTINNWIRLIQRIQSNSEKPDYTKRLYKV